MTFTVTIVITIISAVAINSGTQIHSLTPTEVCNEFACGDGLCIPNKWQCDWEEDCADGSDELNCSPPGQCRDDEFTCSNGRCIPQDWVCDDWIDCPDDELNCPCKGFECISDGRCIPASSECNRHVDCADASDEANCTCSGDEIYCGVCINPIWLCDFVVDCPDGSDEVNCTNLLHSEAS